MNIETFNAGNFTGYCDRLANTDTDLKAVINQHGYPPLWNRPAGFETLIHIILEQQVSLASAKAALVKLKETIGVITPEKINSISNETLRNCYFSRQKTSYAKHLAECILNKQLNLDELQQLTDATVREKLTAVKGIGDWTADVYLMMSLGRLDLFPIGDIALVNSMKDVKQLSKQTSRQELISIADGWKPLRSVAAFILWHAYLKKRNIKV